MIHRHLFILLIASLSFSGASSRNHFFEHYFSKYHIHRSSSTTPSITSTPETVTAESVSPFSQQGDIPSEEYDSSEDEDDDEHDFIANTTPFDSSAQNRDPVQSAFVSRVLTIVGSLVAVVVLLGCIVCCCPNCCRGTERRGFVTGTPISPQAETIQTAQLPVIVQHSPPEYRQENVHVQQFPPQYHQPVLPPSQYDPIRQQGYQYSPVQPQSIQYNQYSPVQPQTHYSPVNQGYPPASALQFHNPPEAPPPYEPTAPKM